LQQQTLKNAISCTGVGLHSGAKVQMVLRPADADTGVVFLRTDIHDRDARIPARWDHVTDTTLCTTIGNDDEVKVATIEHLLAALAGCGIDNVLVELNGPEVPVMDGSAAPFVFLIDCAGVVAQDAPRRAIRVLREVELSDGEARVAVMPSAGFSVSLEINFESPAIARQAGFFDLHNGGFKREICRARTFGFERDVDKLLELGLARGGSLDNVVVISDDHQVMNEGGLRYGDEFLRHKVLDTVGDLFLAGGPLLGHFAGLRSGHRLNNRLLRKLFADPQAWEITETVAQPTHVAPVATWQQGVVAGDRLAATA